MAIELKLTEALDNGLSATIGEHTYHIPAPKASLGLRLRAKFADASNMTETDVLELITAIFGGVMDDDGVPSGGLWDELDANGADVDQAFHLGLTAFYYWGMDPSYAITYWNSWGKGVEALQKIADNVNEAVVPETAEKKTTTKKKTS